MIRSPLLLCLFGILAAAPLHAQRVARPDPPLDPGRAKLRDQILILRDSLNTIDAAAARLQRDVRQAAAVSLVSRARSMSDACTRSARVLEPTRRTVAEAKVSGARQVRRRRELLAEFGRLGGALTRCREEFGAMSAMSQGERVRGYGNDRAERVQAALRRYERTLGEFLGAMGIKVRPLGAGPSPLAG